MQLYKYFINCPYYAKGKLLITNSGKLNRILNGCEVRRGEIIHSTAKHKELSSKEMK